MPPHFSQQLPSSYADGSIRGVAKLARPFRSTRADRLLESVRRDAKRVEDRARFLSDCLSNEAAKNVEEIQDGVRGLQDHVQGMNTMQQDICAMVQDALDGQDGIVKMLSDIVDCKIEC